MTTATTIWQREGGAGAAVARFCGGIENKNKQCGIAFIGGGGVGLGVEPVVCGRKEARGRGRGEGRHGRGRGREVAGRRVGKWYHFRKEEGRHWRLNLTWTRPANTVRGRKQQGIKTCGKPRMKYEPKTAHGQRRERKGFY